MIKIGACVDVSKIHEAASIGYDYIEWSLSSVSELSDAEFEEAAKIVDDAPIKVEAFNGMIPAKYRLTGPDADLDAARAYVEKMVPRAMRVGGKAIVFGSGGARGVPEGASMDEAWRQVASYLEMCEPILADCGINLAIEPLSRNECNIINLVSEAVAISSLVNLPHIGALGDTYHMHNVNEPYEALVNAGNRLYHVHTSHARKNDIYYGRDYPYPGDGEDYPALFAALNKAGYDGRVSIEAGYEDFMRDGAIALAVLKEARG